MAKKNKGVSARDMARICKERGITLDDLYKEMGEAENFIVLKKKNEEEKEERAQRRLVRRLKHEQ